MKKPRIIWLNVSVFVLTFLIAAVGVPYWTFTQGFSGIIIGAAVVSFIYCGMSITTGYHRLWSHKTFQAHWSLRLLCALGGAFALQNSILHWSSDHRIHHKHVDNNDKDPYSAKMGFWYSHIGWMCREYQASRYTDYTNARDLQKDPIVMWQHKYYLALTILMNFGVPITIGFISGDMIGSLLMVGFLRLVLSHHTTFFINSLAHIWGKQTYTDKNTARDNGIIALLTFGEGYHNFHHIFENDYRNGIRWWQFDPTKWLIKGCEFIGITKKLRVTPDDKIEKATLAMTLKLSQQKLKLHPQAEQMLANLQHEYDELMIKMNEYYATKKKLLIAKREQLRTDVENSDLVKQYHELKEKFIEQKHSWHLLTTQLA